MTALQEPQHARRRRVVLWSGLLLALALLLTRCEYAKPSGKGTTGHSPSSAAPSTPIISGGGGTIGAAGAVPGEGFTMVATLTGRQLRPGQTRTLRVAVSNPASRPIQVLTIDVTPQRPSTVGCQASWVQVGRYRANNGPGVKVGARQSSYINVSISLVDLPDINQDACKGARFPLALAGTARQTS
jgi:hypothetical protein